MKLKWTLPFLLLPFLSTSQSYLDHTSTWKEIRNGCGVLNCISEDYTITLPSDTIINGVSYFLPLKQGTRLTTVLTNPDTFSMEEEMFEEYLEPIRSENGILYRYDTYFNTEEVIHDFNLSIGDGIGSCYPAEIVSLIDTVYIGDIERKRYFFEGNPSNYLLEGIGSNKGLFEHPCSGISIEFNSQLDCYAQQGAFIPLSDYKTCGTLVSVQEPKTIEPKIKVFPNPFQGQFTLSLASTSTLNNQNFPLSIYSIDGRLQWSGQWTGPEKMVEVASLPKGIYLLAVLVDDSRQVIKLVKN